MTEPNRSRQVPSRPARTARRSISRKGTSMVRENARDGTRGSWMRIGAVVVAGAVLGGLLLRGGLLGRLGTLALARNAYRRLQQSSLADSAVHFARRAKALTR